MPVLPNTGISGTELNEKIGVTRFTPFCKPVMTRCPEVFPFRLLLPCIRQTLLQLITG